jgi:hypothetical protein
MPFRETRRNTDAEKASEVGKQSKAEKKSETSEQRLWRNTSQKETILPRPCATVPQRLREQRGKRHLSPRWRPIRERKGEILSHHVER